MLTFEKAVILAAQAHRGQSDYAGEPYILHPLRLATRMKTDAARIVAVLHDAMEIDAENRMDFGDLAMCEPDQAVEDALRRLTRVDGEEYQIYLKRCLGSPLALAVKLVDIYDNSNPSRLAAVGRRHGDTLAIRLANKYTKAIKFLKPYLAGARAAIQTHLDPVYFPGEEGNRK